MEPIYIYVFTNHFKGPGQPNMVGTNQDKTFKAAVWKKKDRKGRDMECIKIEGLGPQNPNTIPGFTFVTEAPAEEKDPEVIIPKEPPKPDPPEDEEEFLF